MTPLRICVAVASVLVLAPGLVTAAPPVTALRYHPSGTWLAAGVQQQVYLFAAETGSVVSRVPALPGRVTALAWSPAGHLAVACGAVGESGIVRLYTFSDGLKTATLQREWTAHKDAVYALAFSPDSNTLATGSYDRTIRLWNTAQNDPLLTLTDHSDSVYAVAFSPQGNLLASAAADRTVKLWDPKTGKRLYTLSDPTDWVYALAWHPDGKQITAGGVDKSIRTWRVNDREGVLVRSGFAHNQSVVHLEYAPDGKQLFSVGEDRVIKAWNPETLMENNVFPTQAESVHTLTVHPREARFAVGRHDGMAEVLALADGKVLRRLLPVPPKPPVVSQLSPTLIPRGQPSVIQLTGSDLENVTEVTASRKDVSAKAGPATSDGKRQVTLTVADTAAPGPVELTLHSPAGKSAPLKLMVTRFASTLESDLKSESMGTRELPWASTIGGGLSQAGETDRYAIALNQGQDVAVQLHTSPLGSKLEPVLTLSDAQGKVIAQSALGHLGAKSPGAGRYVLTLHDRDYRGGAEFQYHLDFGPIPVVTTVFPLGVPTGRTTPIHVQGVHLPGGDQGLTVPLTVPKETPAGTSLPVAIPELKETPLGKLTVVAGEFPAQIATPSGTEVRHVPVTVDGILALPGEEQTIRFPAKKGVRLVLETEARRLGSPVDSLIEILDTAGKPVPRATLRCTSKSAVTFRDHDDANPNIRLDVWNELAVDDYLYVGTELIRIKTLPSHPDADCKFYQVGGRRWGYLDTTPAHLAKDSTMFRVEVHPPGAEFPPNGMPVFQIVYRNDDGGPGYGKDSRILFDPPADGIYQVRVRDARGAHGSDHAYRLTIREPRPHFTLAVTPGAPAIWQGGSLPVTITADRKDGFDGPIAVQFEDLPPGITAPSTFIEAEQNDAVVALTASPGAQLPETISARIIATASNGDTPLRQEIPLAGLKLQDGAELMVETSADRLVLHPGQEARIRVRITRQNGLTGRVPLDVQGLPHGVIVLNLGLNGILINPNETEREIVIRAEPWLQPMERPFVILARSERKRTEHAAPSVLLQVQAAGR